MAVSRCLEVTMGSTASLKENKASNKADPYAVLRLGDAECRTDAEALPGARPLWNHRFTFLLPKEPRAYPGELHVDVWDSSNGPAVFLGACRVGIARVYQKRAIDVVQPVHRKCGKLVGHLRFYLAVLEEDLSVGPETPPLPPALPPLQRSAGAETPELARSSADPSSCSGLPAAELKKPADPLAAGQRREEPQDSEIVDVELRGSGCLGRKKRKRGLTLLRSDSSLSRHSLPPKKHWKAPPPLQLCTPGSPASLSALERLMALSPRAPEQALASLAHADTPASSLPEALTLGFPRALPGLSDAETPTGEANLAKEPAGPEPSSMEQPPKHSHTMLGCAGADKGEPALSWSATEKEWDVATLASLTSLVLAGPAAEPNNSSAEVESFLEELNAALGVSPELGAAKPTKASGPFPASAPATAALKGTRSGEQMLMGLFKGFSQASQRLLA